VRTTRERWQRHHLRAAVWLLAAIALSQLVLAAWIECAPEVRDPEYALLRDRLRARATEYPDKPLAVFLGSSRVAYGFDPDAAGDGATALFNFGVPGSGPYLLDVLHERLTTDGVRPGAVFVEVLPAFYNAAGSRELDAALLDGARLTAREVLGLFGYSDALTGPLGRWVHGRALPIHRHQSELRDRIGLDVARDGLPAEGPQTEICPNGFHWRARPDRERAERTALAHRQYDPFYADFHLAEKPYERLLRTIRRAQGTGAAVVLVAMPEGTEFRRLYTPAASAGITELFQRLREDTGAPLVDARDWLPDELFFDQHHLSPDGAGAFSIRFRRDVLPLARR
jgi:hypothetical protein